ncbi:MAG: hypothetical protein QGG42_13805 [Phycisphaerae bacterium]|jgi:hypothetical protein|nr:hypothetical protein [Phycisphaerae bacterium]
MLTEAFLVVGAGGDAFDCPEGFTSENAPEHEATAENPLTAGRLTVCAACDKENCSIKHQTTCRRKAVLSRENFHCPEGQF